MKDSTRHQTYTQPYKWLRHIEPLKAKFHYAIQLANQVRELVCDLLASC